LSLTWGYKEHAEMHLNILNLIPADNGDEDGLFQQVQMGIGQEKAVAVLSQCLGSQS
jgi:hypothetical protein